MGIPPTNLQHPCQPEILPARHVKEQLPAPSRPPESRAKTQGSSGTGIPFFRLPMG